MRRDVLIAVLLAAATLAVYCPVVGHDFVVYDDPVYVFENPHVRDGLTWDGLCWAFTTDHAANWHPATWISHMIDCQLFGLRPGWHHLVGVLLHAANSVLLYLVLKQMTQATGRSLLAAALFALHPLHVESVAWAAERKDVLSTLFWLLTMAAYLRYVRRPGWRTYGVVLAGFTLGLLSKPMVVTLPAVLLLLDFWPLGRFATDAPGSDTTYGKRLAHLVLEKVPLFTLSVLSGIVTLLAQSGGGAVASYESLPLGPRAANALVAYVAYLQKTVWPTGLAVLYPLRHVSAWQWSAAAAILAAVTAAVLRQRNRAPYLAVGWFWYLVTLLPVIGLVQVGVQSMADRYTYIPLVGIFIAFAWAGGDLVAQLRFGRIALPVGAGILVLVCLGLTRTQVGFWRDSVTLFSHAVEVTGENYGAQVNLGAALRYEGRPDEAVPHLREALRICPGHVQAHRNLGAILLEQGRLDDAIVHFRAAVGLQPNNASTHFYLGLALEQRGQLEEAAAHYRKAAALAPERLEASRCLARIAARRSDPESDDDGGPRRGR